MIIKHTNFLHKCVLSIIENPNAIIIVPEIRHLSIIKTLLAENTNVAMEMPIILTLEGMNVSSLFNEDTEFLSRNTIFAILTELTTYTKKLEEHDIQVFVRAMLGELPNLYEHKIQPEDILKKLPSTISYQHEVNLNLLVNVWKAFEVYLAQINAKPYYKRTQYLLDEVLKYAETHTKQLIIVDDFGRSRTLKNLIIQAKESNIDVKIFTDDTQLKTPIAKKIENNSTLEHISVCVCVKHILSNNSESKTLIVCEDENLQATILMELQRNKIPCHANIAKPLESNPLVRVFLEIIRVNIKEIIPFLNIDGVQKEHVLASFIEDKPCGVELWQQIIKLSRLRKIEFLGDIFEFISSKRKFFYSTNQDFTEFLQFKAFIQKEITQTQNIGISINYNFVLHIATSWKIFQDTEKSNVRICSLRDIPLHNINTEKNHIILTSAYKTEPTGNIIFSTGMMKYYEFIAHNPITKYLSSITTELYSTVEIPEIKHTSLLLYENAREAKVLTRSNLRLSNNLQTTISATPLETLLVNPLLYFYKNIKYLHEIPYTKKESLTVGNVVHDILEIITNKLSSNENCNIELITNKSFQEAKIFHMKVFFYEGIIREVENIRIAIDGGQVLAESNDIEHNIVVENITFTLKSRADRIDITPNSTTIHDYKTGKTFTNNEIYNYKKIQLLIPALSLQTLDTSGRYSFIGLHKDLTFNITESILEGFVSIVTECLQKYFIHKEPLEEGKQFYAHTHVARV
ncbi:MAG: hypothetical protein ACI9CD_000281 [Candidatus Deianiraeaceae bacterium]|jgi:hypothetical protein